MKSLQVKINGMSAELELEPGELRDLLAAPVEKEQPKRAPFAFRSVFGLDWVAIRYGQANQPPRHVFTADQLKAITHTEGGIFEILHQPTPDMAFAQFEVFLNRALDLQKAYGLSQILIGDDLFRGPGAIARALDGWHPEVLTEALRRWTRAMGPTRIIGCDEADFEADEMASSLEWAKLLDILHSSEGIEIAFPVRFASNMVLWANRCTWTDIYFAVWDIGKDAVPTWEQVKFRMDEALGAAPKNKPFSFGNLSIMGDNLGQRGWAPETVTRAIRYAYELGAIGCRCYGFDRVEWRLNRAKGVPDQVGAAPGDPRWEAMAKAYASL
ncbi:MAG: hypothetical protein NVS1B5_14550 [Gemmatimonadaceae bacterium]